MNGVDNWVLGMEISVAKNLFNYCFLLQAYSVFESSLKNKTTKSQALHDNFYKEKAIARYFL
jgi:hypothetical protein